MDDYEHHLSDEDRAKVAAMVDHFCLLLERRYSISAAEAAEIIRWTAAYRAKREKVAQTGLFSLIGLLAAAIAAALWEGVRVLIRRGG